LKSANTSTPAEPGYAMPAEWEEHAATWLGWPHNQTDWPDKIDTIRWVYGEIVRKISAGELVRILVRHQAEQKLATSYLKRAGCDLKRVEFVVHPTNRGWTRDSGPIFVKRKHPTSNIQHPTSNTAIVHFHFNAWAKYDDWQKDTKVPETAAKLLKKPIFNAQFNGKSFVIEGGGIEVNGRGTLLTRGRGQCCLQVEARFAGALRKEIRVSDDAFDVGMCGETESHSGQALVQIQFPERATE